MWNVSSYTRSAHVLPTAVRPPITMVRGEGDLLYDDTGRAYLDFVQGWAVNALGHAPPLVTEALSAQARTLIHASAGFYNAPQCALADALAARTGFDQVITFTSGAEANESAIKLARKWGALARGGAHRILAALHGFHGRTLCTMSASGKPQFRGLFEPQPSGFTHVPFGDVAALEAALDHDVVAVMLEPIQGEGGVVVPPRDYLAAVRALTEARGVLMIADEVQTGVGRTGRFLACEHAGVRPDVVTLGKGLGAGVPISAMLTNKELAVFAPGEQGGTHTGHPLLSHVARAVVEHVGTPEFLAGVGARGEALRAELVRLCTRHGHREVRGQGLLWALVLARPEASAVAERARELGLLVNACQPDVLRLMPALNVGFDAIARAADLLEQALCG
jgi:acetylornithine/N-succinyldiaminopimelate aminotransferase